MLKITLSFLMPIKSGHCFTLIQMCSLLDDSKKKRLEGDQLLFTIELII